MYYLKDKDKVIGTIYKIDEQYYFIYSEEKYSDIMKQLLLDVAEDMCYTTDIERYFKYWINDIHIERRNQMKNYLFYDEYTGEEFIVETDMKEKAYLYAYKYFKEPKFCGEISYWEAEMYNNDNRRTL